MAIKKGRAIPILEDEMSYLSDESDFYGDENVQLKLEDQARNFNAREWWEQKIPSLTEMADTNMELNVEPKAATLYNPYEGQIAGRQLDETVDEFLKRLPPATSQTSEQLPWIFIANPYRKAPKQEAEGQLGEGPPDEESNWAKFVVEGTKLLEQLRILKNQVEQEKDGLAKAAVTRATTEEKDTIAKRILQTAERLHCTSGKWMIFCQSEEVDDVWAVVAKNTALNELGIAAKVAPNNGGDARISRLICIYTNDFSDLKDVGRVVTKLRDLGLIEMRNKIYYKPDAYTYLGINSKNEYNIQASLYNSRQLLGPKGAPSKNLDKENLFYKRKDPGDYRTLEYE